MSRDTKQIYPSRRLIPVTEWNSYHVWPPIGGLRYLIFLEKTNGFSHWVCRKIAREGWLRKAKDGVLDPASPKSQEHDELKRLRKENRQLLMEREILKKATAF